MEDEQESESETLSEILLNMLGRILITLLLLWGWHSWKNFYSPEGKEENLEQRIICLEVKVKELESSKCPTCGKENKRIN